MIDSGLIHEDLPEPADIRRIYRLIHELCELGTDTYAWRHRMMAEMEIMIDAPMSVSYVFPFSFIPADMRPQALVYMERGMNDVWRQYLSKGDMSSDPMTSQITSRFGTDFTVLREDFVDDEAWYGSAYYHDVRLPSDIDSAVYSQVAVKDPNVIDGLSLARRVGMPRFTRKEVGVVRFLHQELARLWNRQDSVDTHMLPPRERQALEGIRRGYPRKKIATEMGISPHTVHTYEKSLYTRAGVISRGGLLASLSGVIRPNLIP